MLFNRMKGILSYKLKGKYGWSSYQPDIIDVADIISLSYKKRLFCLLDKESPYTLNIECFHITSKTSRGTGLTFIPRNNFKSIITRRFKTVVEIEKQINILSNYQNLLDNYAIKIRNKLLE